MKLMPSVPTMDEDGVKDYPMLWTGIFAPKGTPAPVLKSLEEGFAKAVKDPKFIDAMTKAKMPILYLDSTAFKTKIDNDVKYFEAYKTEKNEIVSCASGGWPLASTANGPSPTAQSTLSSKS